MKIVILAKTFYLAKNFYSSIKNVGAIEQLNSP